MAFRKFKEFYRGFPYAVDERPPKQIQKPQTFGQTLKSYKALKVPVSVSSPPKKAPAKKAEPPKKKPYLECIPPRVYMPQCTIKPQEKNITPMQFMPCSDQKDHEDDDDDDDDYEGTCDLVCSSCGSIIGRDSETCLRCSDYQMGSQSSPDDSYDNIPCDFNRRNKKEEVTQRVSYYDSDKTIIIHKNKHGGQRNSDECSILIIHKDNSTPAITPCSSSEFQLQSRINKTGRNYTTDDDDDDEAI